MRVIIVVLLLLPAIAFSQGSIKRYLLISYEYKHKRSIEGAKGALFIIDQDSLSNSHFMASPLWLRGYSDSSLSDCINNRTFDRLNILKGSNISLDSPYTVYYHEVQYLIKGKGKRVQRIKKFWDNGQREIAIVSITPISGQFCFSNVLISGETGYFERVYIPLERIEYDEQFWHSEKSRLVKGYDFGELMYHRRFY